MGHRLSRSRWLSELPQGEQKGQGRGCHGLSRLLRRLSTQPRRGCPGFEATGGHRNISRLVANI
jgi:hypothetical protein